MDSQNNEPRFEVSIHKSIIGKKPEAIRSEGWERKSRTAKELLEGLTGSGYAIIPVALKGNRRTKDQFESASLVMLDFDSGKSFEEISNSTFIRQHGLFEIGRASCRERV